MTITLNGSTGETPASWTTSTRPATPNTGQTGYNTTTGAIDIYNGSSWTSVPMPTSQGTSGQYLQSAGAGAAPTWAAVGGTPTGAVMAFAGSSAPTGWVLCDGSAQSRSTYAALFAVIGTTYGAGDGSTTFNLPDLRGRAVAGQDNMGGTAANRITTGGSGINGTTLGAAGGAETFTITTTQLPSHSHGPTTRSQFIVANSGSSQVGTVSCGSSSGFAGVSNTATTGSGGASNVTQPTMIMNYIIKT